MNYLSFNNFYLFKWICNKSFPSISIFNRKSSFEFDWNQFCGLNCLRRKLLLPIGQTALSRLGWINCEMEIFLISDFKQNVFWRLLYKREIRKINKFDSHADSSVISSYLSFDEICFQIKQLLWFISHWSESYQIDFFGFISENCSPSLMICGGIKKMDTFLSLF